jgi:hypothetical protein
MATCNGNTYANALNGSISFADGFKQYYNRINIKTGQALIDVSAFGGTGYQVFIQGIKYLSGSASGFLSTSSGGNPFASAAFSCGTITITFDVGCSVTCGCLIGESDITENYEGGSPEITTTWAYSDSAVPTVTWTTS